MKKFINELNSQKSNLSKQLVYGYNCLCQFIFLNAQTKLFMKGELHEIFTCFKISQYGYTVDNVAETSNGFDFTIRNGRKFVKISLKGHGKKSIKSYLKIQKPNNTTSINVEDIPFHDFDYMLIFGKETLSKPGYLALYDRETIEKHRVNSPHSIGAKGLIPDEALAYREFYNVPSVRLVTVKILEKAVKDLMMFMCRIIDDVVTNCGD